MDYKGESKRDAIEIASLLCLVDGYLIKEIPGEVVVCELSSGLYVMLILALPLSETVSAIICEFSPILPLFPVIFTRELGASIVPVYWVLPLPERVISELLSAET